MINYKGDWVADLNARAGIAFGSVAIAVLLIYIIFFKSRYGG